jgi:hypothetical protein
MEKLPKDMLNTVVNELSPQDFVSFCASKATPNIVRFCKNEEIWKKRLNKDFHLLSGKFEKLQTKSRENYLTLFRNISALAEELTEVNLSHYEDMQEFLKPEFRSAVYISFYKVLIEIMDNVRNFEKQEDDFYTYENDFYDVILKTFIKNQLVRKYLPGPKDETGYTDYWLEEILDPYVYPFVINMLEFLRQFQ